jgi:hypothetical protein
MKDDCGEKIELFSTFQRGNERMWVTREKGKFVTYIYVYLYFPIFFLTF